ncbi:MAG: DUF4912 domain-containing protein [Myxococcales bacterium]|nr:DUF4912 domain-containing protein [Myxococcales bacterium]
MQHKDLEQLSREELIEKAEALGIARARTLTMAELVDELCLADERRTGERKPRGWFGRARDLLTSVIDRGLAMPEAPKRRATSRVGNAAPPPLPTVTLAEIYAAQGHLERAVSTLDEVLAKEPGHDEALRLRERFQAQLRKTKPSTVPPAPQVIPLTPPSSPGADAADSLAVGKNVEIGDGVAAAPASAPETPADATPPAADLAQHEEQTFDVDEVVAVAVDPHTVYVYWEVRPKTFAAARGRAPDGALVVRVVAISAASSGPSTDTRDIRVDALFGELFVRGLPQGAQVRLSIGYATESGFEPFAVGLELTTPRARPTAQPAATFRRWSEVRAEVEDTTLPRPTGTAAGAPPALPSIEQRAEAPTALPAPAWVETPRFVQVSEPVPAGNFRHVSFHRLPGSSDIFRKEAFFSRGPFRPGGVDSHGFRAAPAP